MQTPWGTSQYERQLGEGIIFYGTAGHGGAKVQHEQNLLIPPALRNKNGWYEEDCEIEKLCFVFPHLFPTNDQERTIAFLKNYIPDEFEKATGTAIPMEESREKRQRKFYIDNAENFITFSATGSNPDNDIPEGWVKVYAMQGKFYNQTGRTDKEEKEFLVPQDEYRGRGEFSFVIDTTRHPEYIRKAA